MRRAQNYVPLALGAILPVLAILAEHLAPSNPDEFKPDEIKAAFLGKIPSYVQWPAKMNGKADDKIVLGLFGDNALKDLLEQLTKEAKERPIEVRKVDRPAEINQCHILYVPLANNAKWLALRKEVDLRGLLTVGESDNFLEQGGVLVFRLNETRRFWVNVKNKDKAGLEIKSQFYRIIKPVK
ncbi:MAG: YfiR family protein [Verrucomicrobia bacterium]|nr:YfiR family protein [Verrucomicrobiota bacterium]